MRGRQAQLDVAEPLLRELHRNAPHFYFQRRAHNSRVVWNMLDDIESYDACAAATAAVVKREAARRARARCCEAVVAGEEAYDAEQRAIAFAGSRWGMLQREAQGETAFIGRRHVGVVRDGGSVGGGGLDARAGGGGTGSGGSQRMKAGHGQRNVDNVVDDEDDDELDDVSIGRVSSGADDDSDGVIDYASLLTGPGS